MTLQAFHEVRIADCFSLGAVGGPGFSTTIAEMASGFEQRNVNWSVVRHRFDVARTIKNNADFATLLAFFYCRRGKACGFRFKHWADYTFDNRVGTGTGAQQSIQLYKRYDDNSGNPFDRPLKKIVSGSYTVYFDGVAQTEGSPSFVNVNTGILTCNAGGGAVIRVAGQFDVPVRFDIDLAQISTDGPIDFHNWQQIPLVEVRIA